MAALPENDRIAGPFIAAAGQTDFPADFPLLIEDALRARVVRAGREINLAAPDVVAVDASASGFTCRLSAAAQAGDLCWIYSRLPAARPRQHTPNGAIRTPTLEDDAESFQAQLQEHRATLLRASTVPFGETAQAIPARERLKGRFLAGSALTGDLTAVDRALAVPASDQGVALAMAETPQAAGALLGYLPPFPGSQPRGLFDKLKEVLDIRDFGAVGDGGNTVVKDTDAALKAIAALQTNSEYRGGVLYVPEGRFKIALPLVLQAYLQVHNIYIVGESPLASHLDFSSLAAGLNGIEIGAGAHFGIRDLSITGLPSDPGQRVQGSGVVVNKGLNPFQNDAFASHFAFENLRVQYWAGRGLDLVNTYRGTLRDSWIHNIDDHGVQFRGGHTTMLMESTYVEWCGHAAVRANGMVGSAFFNNPMDRNEFGYDLTNLVGCAFEGSGYGELNRKTLIRLRTGDSFVTGLPAEYQDIKGVSFANFWSWANSQDGAGLYPALLDAVTANGRAMSFALLRSTDFMGAGASGHVSVRVDGASGRIRMESRGNILAGTENVFNDVLVQDERSAGVVDPIEVVPGEGGDFQWPRENTFLSLSPATGLNAFTLRLPQNPRHGMIYRCSTKKSITALTVTGATNDAPGVLPAGAGFALIYMTNLAGGPAWRRLPGG